MYKTILVAVDGGPTSSLVVKEASFLAKIAGSKLYIIYVADVMLPSTADVGYIVIDLEKYRQSVIARGQEILNNMKTIASQENIQHETKVIENADRSKISLKIIETASDLKADIIVLGTHGRRGFNRFLIGSVAEEVARIADTPVLLIREKVFPNLES